MVEGLQKVGETSRVPWITEASPLCNTAKRVRENRSGFKCVDTYKHTHVLTGPFAEQPSKSLLAEFTAKIMT